MQEKEFKEWLKGQGFPQNSISSRMANCRWIEANVPQANSSFVDLDTAYDSDECFGLMKFLEYNKNAYHPLAKYIGDGNANIGNNLSTYRTALRLYIKFRQKVVYDKREMSSDQRDISRTSIKADSAFGYTDPLPDDCGPVATLWKSYRETCEALTEALGRTSNILGEVAERVVAEYHSGKLLTASAASADVELDDGTLIQVKSRIPRQGVTTSLSAIRSWSFDRMAVLLFNESGSIKFGGEIDVEAAKEYATEVPHTNSWNISTTSAFLGDPRFIDLTQEYNDVLTAL